LTPLLSILIPTLPDRRPLLGRLWERLRPQVDAAGGAVAVLPLPDDGKLTVGRKRQLLLQAAATPYVAFVDDDDLVSDDYCPCVLEGLRAGADVVGFRLNHYTDGVLTGHAIHSLRVSEWKYEHDPAAGLYFYERTPNHLNPIRRELALSIGYKSLDTGEDADYSRRLFERHGATMREHFVDAPLYHYFYRLREVVPIIVYDDDGNLTRAGAEKAIREGGSAVWGGKMCTRVEQLDEVEA